MNFASQAPYAVRFEWGANALESVEDAAGITIIIDVLSFTTCVDIACSRGAIVIPYRFKDASAEIFAKESGAVLAGARGGRGLSLSPVSLQEIGPGTRLVLPSPNGSTLTLRSRANVTLAACFRNSAAVARYAQARGGEVTVVACGERWDDGSLRPCIEDYLCAGAIVGGLSGTKSPEALVAEAAFAGVGRRLAQTISSCASAVELAQRGFAGDVNVALELNKSACVPRLVEGAFIQSST